MRRYTPGTLRTNAASACNATDIAQLSLATNTNAQLTSGATLIDAIDLAGPTQGQDWTLLSLSIEAQLSFQNYSSATTDIATFGRLGRILAGIILDSGTPTQGIAGYPWQPVMENLPADATLLSALWDPEDDAMPPTVTGLQAPPAPTLTLSTSIIPSGGPIDITGAIQAYVGLWIEPSLIGVYCPTEYSLSFAECGLLVSGGEYTVNYDDGL